GYSGGYAQGAYNNPILQNAQNFAGLDKIAQRRRRAGGVLEQLGLIGPKVAPGPDRTVPQTSLAANHGKGLPWGGLPRGQVTKDSDANAAIPGNARHLQHP